MPYSRGDVVLVLFPDSNLVTAKRRPALVVQADQLQTGLAQTIVAMITSNLSRLGHPSRVTAPRSSSQGLRMGLLSDSVIMTDNLATVLDVEIDRKIGCCDDMRAVDAALQHTLGLGKVS
ncbi:MAG: type II toxin-antitoxin system PemK/MazF family toxin [Planctomycetes bacterium]|nr:type II toxin-antitoxin system PemK/MazF family toxin [Planctomycetota bacterium]MBU4399162.1 type II toxin-antitoxin system PemK/MazF family toxin [Planctomycetota bacterium]MCG2682218.1 type II toxin-antitoxin system PemK/MazF family toxin [Planctomycetales bacterium]